MEENKKPISKIQKTRKQNNRGKKGKSKRKNWETMDLSICILFCIYFAFSICLFCLHLFCFLPGKKTCKRKAKKQIEKAKYCKKQCKWTIHCFPSFSLFDVPFFPIYFASGFFQFWSFVFWCSMWSPFFPRASERRVLPIVGVCLSSSHLHIFSPSHLHIFSSSHLLIFTSSHPHIFSSSHLLIFTSAHLHIFTSSHLHIFSSCPLGLLPSSSHLLILTSSHLHHILTSSHLHLFTSCPLALLPSCPLAFSFFSISLLKAGAGAVPTRRHETSVCTSVCV